MTMGTVKFYNDQKGFGFIQPNDGSKDVFVHATALERAGMRGLRRPEGLLRHRGRSPHRQDGRQQHPGRVSSSVRRGILCWNPSKPLPSGAAFSSIRALHRRALA